MAATTYSVTLHHLAPGAKAAGLQYPDEQLQGVTPEQLGQLLHALEELAAKVSLYEPSTPELRVKTDREVFIVRTRSRNLCFVGHETALRGEDHSVAYIMAAITGQALTVDRPAVNPRLFDRPPTAIPVRQSGRRDTGGGIGVPDWLKIGLLAVVSFAFVGAGLWLLFKPARSLAPNFKLMPATESVALLGRVAGQYQTGNQPGDRRLIIDNAGTMRIAKFGPDQSIAEEIIRTARGATQDGKPALATSDPYLMRINDADSVTLYGQVYKRVVR
ncbi:MAG: hypothetical protein QG602_2217 [Verrucomicrobiota bacterium]|nr:hypothetical protein [Verrucomicrobiota bacterium]